MPSKTGAKKARTAPQQATATAPATGAKPPASTTSHSQVIDIQDEQIRRRAYELYVQRGCLDGYHEQDWFQAETELRSRTA